MNTVHFLQFLIYSACVNIFSVFIYLCYLSDKLSGYKSKVVLSEYDYIIVGAGTAGSLIAQRIEQETNLQYILIEAGGHGNLVFDIPVLGPLLHGSKFDWQYETVPQDNSCSAMEDKKCKLTLGKIVGGSSKLNNMVHIRGNLTHYAGWFYNKYNEEYIKKQFEFLEKNIISIDNLKYESKLSGAIMLAARELGYKKIKHSKFEEGFMKSKLSQKGGKRFTTSDLVSPGNILTGAMVEKVLFNNQNNAIGIRVNLGGKKFNIKVKKGVILSAGTINTPKILQLSGIGQSELLQKLKIPVIKELPVGKNLQDHVTTGLDLVMFNNTLNLGAGDMINPFNLYQYFVDGKGPFTSPGCEVLGFMSTNNMATPDLQFMVLPVGISSDRGSHLKNQIGIKDDVWKQYFSQTFDRYTATVLPIVLHPKSKGDVYITSKNPHSKPAVDPKFLSHKNDVKVLVNGLKLVKRFVETKAMKSIEAYLNPIKFPGCESYDIFSDQYWHCYVKQLTLTTYHPVGTCSMGRLDDATSVVDTSFQVIGVKRLYVADGSVLPTLPSGNVNAAIAMMANVFFENVIFYKYSRNICQNIDFLHEIVYKICM